MKKLFNIDTMNCMPISYTKNHNARTTLDMINKKLGQQICKDYIDNTIEELSIKYNRSVKSIEKYLTKRKLI